MKERAISNETLQLSDGRSLGYRTLGDPDGHSLFFFHGTPGSRLVLADSDRLAQVPGLQLILPERPGYGLSDPKPERTLLDWPDDVVRLADHLGLDAFAVAGESGGGPHALACAYRLPERVRVALLLGSPSPADFPGATKDLALGNRLGVWLNRFAPWFARAMIRLSASGFQKDPERFVDALARQMAPADQVLLAKKSFRQLVQRDFQEAYRQGGEGHAVDGNLTLTSRSWGFDLSEIAVPVHLWHGEDDTLVSTAMARHLAQRIPDCSARFIPGAGHILTEVPEVVEGIERVVCRGRNT